MNQIRGAIRVMVADELRRAGQRFVSARYISQRFKVSYQTAHRLLVELQSQGLIVRRAGSGSFISGQTKSLRSALLIFAGRARRPGSFGNLLLKQLVARLEAIGLPFEILVGRVALKQIPEDVYPVLWETSRLTQDLAAKYRFSLVLHDKPPAGIGSLYTDSISVDDFSGGLVLTGFGNAPVTERLGLSTIGIPWEEIARNAAAIIKKRLDGRSDHASSIVLPRVPVMRSPAGQEEIRSPQSNPAGRL